jgi:hypothetical protein
MASITDHAIHFFADDAAVRRVAAGLLDCTLPVAEWTHEAHLAATLCLITEYPDFDVERDMPGAIAGYNVSQGGVNDDMRGYHETITQTYIRGVRAHLAGCRASTLAERVNSLLASYRGRRDYPLRFYSPERLFSIAARRSLADPDLCPFEEI